MGDALVRSSTAGQVKRIISERILNGDLAPGTRIRELHLASELQVSQGPVREALRELEAQGLVRSEPFKGTSVREVTQTDLREAYIVRAALEELSGRLAAPHFKENVARLEELAGEIRHAAKLDDISGYVKSDVAFHRTIVEGTNNKVLLRSWDALGFEVRMQIRLANRSLNLALTQKEHWPIIEALREGAGRKAGKLLQQHVFNFAKL